MQFYPTLSLSYFNSSQGEVFCASNWTIPQCQWWPKASQGCKIKNWFLPTTIYLCLSGHYTSSLIQINNLHITNEKKFVLQKFLDSICVTRRWELSHWIQLLIHLTDNPIPQSIKMILSNREKLPAADVLQLTGQLVCWWAFFHLESFLFCLKQTWKWSWSTASLLYLKTSTK